MRILHTRLLQAGALGDTTFDLGMVDTNAKSTAYISVETIFTAADRSDRFAIRYLLGTTPKPLNAVIPEPGTGSLLALGLAALAAKRRSRQTHH